MRLMRLIEMLILVGCLFGGKFLCNARRAPWAGTWPGRDGSGTDGVPLVLRAYLYETRGELIEPAATCRMSVTVLVPLLTLWVTESSLAFALVCGAALGLFLCYPFGDDDERRTTFS